MFEAFHNIEEKSKAGNRFAVEVLKSWAEGEWFLSKPEVPEKNSIKDFKVGVVKQTPTTCCLHQMRGVDQIFLCMPWQC